MLKHESEINGYAIHASDGLIGTVRDFLFDDHAWMIRWLVIDTGHWLSGREVLLPPSALVPGHHSGRQFNVRLTRQQVKDCPDIETDFPVSRQRETDIYNYYDWSPYWGGGAYMSMVGYGGAGMVPTQSLELTRREMAIDHAKHPKGDPTLRSVREVVGYHIHASDGDIGHVEDILVEDNDWSVCYLVVDTKNWWRGTKVLISPPSIRTIDWADRQVNLGLDRQRVKESPTYDPLASADPIHEKRIHKYEGDLPRR
jgi:hypothetical protein